MKKSILTVFLMLCIAVSAVQGMVFASGTDITYTGVDFLTDAPQQETVYTAGEGTVTYTPGDDGESAVITLENAAINGSVRRVEYKPLSYASAALLAKGNINLVLVGDNKITITENGTQGVFFYESNLKVTGSGSLTIDVTGADTFGNSPFDVSNYNNRGADDSFILESGNITIKENTQDYAYCLMASEGMTVKGGSLTTDGGNCSIVCTKGDISILGGTVNCKNYAGDSGIWSFNGSIIISGNDTTVNVSSLEKDKYSFGLFVEHEIVPEGNVYISGGNVNISSGQIGIYVDYQGDINISGGNVTTAAENGTDEGIAVGMYATGSINITGGNVTASGVGNSNITGVGMYSDTNIAVSGGNITAQGVTQAISPAPNFTEYANPVITAAADFDGKDIQEYDEAAVDSYKYLSVAGKGYAISYDNGKINISSPENVNAYLVLAKYDNLGKLTDIEIKNTDISVGNNSIVPDHFTFDSGSIKIMLWDSFDSMNQLCEPEDIII